MDRAEGHLCELSFADERGPVALPLKYWDDDTFKRMSSPTLFKDNSGSAKPMLTASVQLSLGSARTDEG